MKYRIYVQKDYIQGIDDYMFYSIVGEDNIVKLNINYYIMNAFADMGDVKDVNGNPLKLISSHGHDYIISKDLNNNILLKQTEKEYPLYEVVDIGEFALPIPVKNIYNKFTSIENILEEL